MSNQCFKFGFEIQEWSGHHCVKSVQIRSFSGPYFPVFRLNTFRIQSECGEIQTRKKSIFGHFSRSACLNKPSAKSCRFVCMYDLLLPLGIKEFK